MLSFPCPLINLKRLNKLKEYWFNKDIEKALGISHEDLINIRQGNVILSKDILYALFASLKLSTLEIKALSEKAYSSMVVMVSGNIQFRII